jgi:hypothetical protein
MVKIFRPPTADPTDERFAFRYGDRGTVEINDGGAIRHETEVPEGWVEMVPGWTPGQVWERPDRPVGNPGTHRSHCCARHGCKYSSPGCPVLSGELVQDHPCEVCEFDDEDDEEGPHI